MAISSPFFLNTRQIGYVCDFEVLDHYDRIFYLAIECPCDLPEDAYAFYEDFVRDLPVKEHRAGIIRPMYSMRLSK